MADSWVAVADVAEGTNGRKLVDNDQVTNGNGEQVHRQRVVVAEADDETRLDYDTRTDGNPVYVGAAAQGTATTATIWRIQKLAYDTSARLTRVQVLRGAWDSRSTLGWS